MDLINNAKDALEWLKENPRVRLEDEYGNYYWYVPDEKIIEYHHQIDEWDWDMDRLSEEDFLALGKFDFYPTKPLKDELDIASREYEETRQDGDCLSDNEMVRRAFKAGANWQREHVWHDPDEEPETERKIIWEDENHLGKHLFAGDWKAMVDCFGRKERWCYRSDILPKKRLGDDNK